MGDQADYLIDQMMMVELDEELAYDRIAGDAENKFWVTKDGDRLQYSEMSDSHLSHTIAFIGRKDRTHAFHCHMKGLKREFKKRKARS